MRGYKLSWQKFKNYPQASKSNFEDRAGVLALSADDRITRSRVITNNSPQKLFLKHNLREIKTCLIHEQKGFEYTDGVLKICFKILGAVRVK